MLDVNILKPNEHYSALKKRKSIVIFITEKDVLGEGEPTENRIIITRKADGKFIGPPFFLSQNFLKL